jgi:ankyrin repeat protein
MSNFEINQRVDEMPGKIRGLSGWWIVPILSVANLAAGSSDLRLVDAVQHRDQQAVRSLLKQQVDVNKPQPDGATGLHWAAYWDDLEMADLLIRAGAKVDAVNDLGVSPLSVACTNGNATAMVARLLSAGANPNVALPTGETALMTCARTGNIGAVKALLAGGADPNAKESEHGQTSLMWAVSERHPEVVDVLVEHSADVRSRSTGGFTPLLFAARAGDVDSARILLAAGADVNETAPDGSSPLLVASASLVATTASDYRLVASPSGHEALAMLLLATGADPAKADNISGSTPLHAAVETGRLELLKGLLSHGANPNVRLVKGPPPLRGDVYSRAGLAGATPFWLAAKAGNVGIMRALVAAGADPQLATANETTPLMAAAGIGQPNETRTPAESRALEAVKLTMELGANVNATNQAGQTALHGAANIGADKIIQFLVEHGGRLDVQDKLGRTPLTLADDGRRRRSTTVDLLRKLSGATNPDGR